MNEALNWYSQQVQHKRTVSTSTQLAWCKHCQCTVSVTVSVSRGGIQSTNNDGIQNTGHTPASFSSFLELLDLVPRITADIVKHRTALFKRPDQNYHNINNNMIQTDSNYAEWNTHTHLWYNVCHYFPFFVSYNKQTSVCFNQLSECCIPIPCSLLIVIPQSIWKLIMGIWKLNLN